VKGSSSLTATCTLALAASGQRRRSSFCPFKSSVFIFRTSSRPATGRARDNGCIFIARQLAASSSLFSWINSRNMCWNAAYRMRSSAQEAELNTASTRTQSPSSRPRCKSNASSAHSSCSLTPDSRSRLRAESGKPKLSIVCTMSLTTCALKSSSTSSTSAGDQSLSEITSLREKSWLAVTEWPKLRSLSSRTAATPPRSTYERPRG
jgi:hypothetical protein